MKSVRATALASMMILLAVPQARAECGPAAAALSAVEGYAVSVPPAGDDGGWCVLDGADFRSQRPGWPDLTVERLRLRQSATELDLDLQGLRASPRASDGEVDERVRSMVRLQSADLRLRAVHDPAENLLSISGLRFALSGGTTLELDAEIRGAGLSLASLALGEVTRATLVWRADGRLLRPVMDLAGEGLAGTGGTAAIEASRSVLAELVLALPAGTLDDASRQALEAAVRAMPQGRGKLTLTVVSPDGIGAGRLAPALLSDKATTAEAAQALFAGATITASWQPGLAP